MTIAAYSAGTEKSFLVHPSLQALCLRSFFLFFRVKEPLKGRIHIQHCRQGVIAVKKAVPDGCLVDRSAKGDDVEYTT